MSSSILNSSGALTTLFGQTAGTKSILATSNTAIFSMSNLVSKVRNLSNQASQLQESDKTGIAALHKQVAAALDTFNNISSTVQSSGTLTSASGATITGATTATATSPASTGSTSTPTADKVPTLAELKTTLASMQTTLAGNINKVGFSISKAILASGQASASSSMSTAYSTNSASNSMSALWAKLYGSGSRYL